MKNWSRRSLLESALLSLDLELSSYRTELHERAATPRRERKFRLRPATRLPFRHPRLSRNDATKFLAYNRVLGSTIGLSLLMLAGGVNEVLLVGEEKEGQDEDR